jgi:hypothetical protein
MKNRTTETVTLERVRIVRATLDKLDMHTVRLGINDHNFCLDLPEFMKMADTLLDYWAEFRQAQMADQVEAEN